MRQIEPAPITTRTFCSQLSLQLGEQIYGTATANTTVWLVLEYARPWGAKALDESTLPAAVKQRLFDLQTTIPGARVQFIKRHDRAPDAGVHFFVGLSTEQQPALYRFQLHRYDDLPAIDVAGLVAEPAVYASFLHKEPLFLVCTNGKRDQCCAKWGLPVYQAMAAHAGDTVWQTTHTGGHRFAATMICLPHGVSYGRLTPEDVAPLVEAYRQGMLYRLDCYRGRTCYDSVTQVADAFLRERTGNHQLSGFQHVATESTLDNGLDNVWQVHFRAQAQGTLHTLRIKCQMEAVQNPHSCAKNTVENSPLYRVVDYVTS